MLYRPTTAYEPSPDAIRRAEQSRIDIEQDFEGWLEENPDMIEPGLRIIARRLDTDAEPIDFVGLDRTGRLVVIEIKKALTWRETLGRVLDAVVWLGSLTEEGLQSTIAAVAEERGRPNVLTEVAEAVPGWRPFDETPRCILVGNGSDAALRRTVELLASRYQFPVNGVFLEVFKSSTGSVLLTRSVVVDDAVAVETGRRGKKAANVTAAVAAAPTRAAAEGLLNVWKNLTGREGRRADKGKYWNLPGRRDAGTAVGALCPFDEEAGDGSAWIKLYSPTLASDTGLTADEVRRRIGDIGLPQDNGRIKLTTPDAADRVRALLADLYAAPRANGV